MKNDQQASILAIDDDPIVRMSIAGYLEDRGYQVYQAENGREGIELFNKDLIDLVIVDLQMPLMNGLEVMKHIRNVTTDIPLIVISGTGLVEDAVDALRLGAWDYIFKPIKSVSILDHALKNALEKARLKRENQEYQQNLQQMVETRTAELQKSNMKLLQRERQLRQAHKMEALGTLAGGIAHDFNNLLGAIIGCTDLSLREVPKGSPCRKHLDQVMEAATRASELVKQILSFSRQKELTRKPLKLTSILDEVIQVLKITLPENIEIDRSINVEADTILGDPAQMHRVVMNLATNAIYAMQEEGGVLTFQLNRHKIEKPSISLGKLSPGDYIKLTVSDSGQGIASQNMERIFNPYFTTKKLGEGAGLGLAVVAGIVEKYEGTVTVDSEWAKGSRFEIYLPLQAVAQPV
jgi:signal transduction histidine kinase